MKQIKTIVKMELAAGSVASPYYYEMEITHQLCRSACADSVPLFSPTVSVVSTQSVGTSQYLITLAVEGVLHYTPCNGCDCAVKAETINENIVVPLYSETAPTSVTLVQGTVVNTLQTEPCKNCSNEFVSNVPLTLTVA